MKFKNEHEELMYRAELFARCIKELKYKIQTQVNYNNLLAERISHEDVESLEKLTKKVERNKEKDYSDEIAKKFLNVSKEQMKEVISQITF